MNRPSSNRFRLSRGWRPATRWLKHALLAALWSGLCANAAPADLHDVVAEVQRKVVKIYGAGGIRGLEAYQSGFVISATGHVLTVWSYVLDTDDLAVVLDDGSRYPGEIVFSQPRLDLAILKIEASDLPHFDLAEAVELSAGQRVLAFSNLYGIASGNEPASVLHGHVSAVSSLRARRGAFNIPYSGLVYIVDAMTNNAGAAGGALTDEAGRLAGMLGKEIKSRDHDVWLNYALPIKAFYETVQAALSGESLVPDTMSAVERSQTPWTLEAMGVRLVPNLIKNTPPFVESVDADSVAQRAGLQPDDLLIYVDSHMVKSYRELESVLGTIDRVQPLTFSVIRDQELVTLMIEGLED